MRLVLTVAECLFIYIPIRTYSYMPINLLSPTYPRKKERLILSFLLPFLLLWYLSSSQKIKWSIIMQWEGVIQRELVIGFLSQSSQKKHRPPTFCPLLFQSDPLWFFALFIRPMAVVVSTPAKILSHFLCTAPLQYVPKIQFTQVTIDCLPNNKTKNALHNETVILNYVYWWRLSHSLYNWVRPERRTAFHWILCGNRPA